MYELASIIQLKAGAFGWWSVCLRLSWQAQRSFALLWLDTSQMFDVCAGFAPNNLNTILIWISAVVTAAMPAKKVHTYLRH